MQAGQCNTYLSNTSTIARLAFITNFLTENGFYVVLQDTESGLAIDNPDAWLSNWASLLPQLKAGHGVIVDPISPPSIPYESAGELFPGSCMSESFSKLQACYAEWQVRLNLTVLSKLHCGRVSSLRPGVPTQRQSFSTWLMTPFKTRPHESLLAEWTFK